MLTENLRSMPLVHANLPVTGIGKRLQLGKQVAAVPARAG
jgi:hypothetical protein